MVNAEPCICSPRPGTSESQAEELTTEHDAGHTFCGVTAVALGAARPASRPCAAPVGPPFGAGDSFQPAQADAGAAFPLWGSCDAPVLCPPSQPLPSAPRTPPPPPVPRLSWFLFAELRHLPGSPLFVQGPGVLLPETLAARGPLWLDPAPPRLPERWRSLAWRWEPAPQGHLLCGSRAAASGAELDLCQGHS